MRVVLMIVLLVLSIGITGLTVYFTGMLEMPVVPGWVFMVALVYIALQLLRGMILPGSGKKTDWIYYVGLILMAIPAFLEQPNDVLPYRWLLVFGVSSTIIPPLLDILNWKKEQTT